MHIDQQMDFRNNAFCDTGFQLAEVHFDNTRVVNGPFVIAAKQANVIVKFAIDRVTFGRSAFQFEVLLTNSRKTALVNYVFSFGFLKGRKPLTPRSGFVLKEYFPNRLIWANGAGEINSKSFSSIGYPSWCNSLIISCI